MKKYLILFLLVSIVFSMTSCGGSGAGSSSSPPGENPGVPFLIELRPSHSVAQTNTFIYIRARVLNGNGNPITGIPVYFTNRSPIGTFDVNPPVVNTDQYGYATVKLSSTTPGFSTVQAEVNTGAGQVGERKILYFSDFALMWPQPTITLSIDADNDGIYNENSDFNFFETSTDDTAIIKAIARDEFGNKIVGVKVTFSGDTGASFPLGDTFTTNSNGEAFAQVKINPTSFVGFETALNIQARGENGAVGFIAVFLKPITIAGITLVADPTVIGLGETSAIAASVTTSPGIIPNDVPVQFSVIPVTKGSVSPVIALTENGVATTTFTASATATGTATITGSVGGLSNATTVTVLLSKELTVTPASITVTGTSDATDNVTFYISGGSGTYTGVFSNNTAVIPNPAIAVNQFTITPAVVATSTTVTLTVVDSLGATKTVSVTVTPATSSMAINPSAISVDLAAGTVTFNIIGGLPPYDVFTTNSTIVTVDGGAKIDDLAAHTFDAQLWAIGSVTITVVDSNSKIVTATIAVSTGGGGGGPGMPMSISPTTATVAGLQNPDSNAVDNIDFVLSNVSGGSVNCISSQPAIIASPGAFPSTGGNIFTIDPNAVAATTLVTITCTDGDGFVASALVTVVPPALQIKLTPIHVIGRANPPGGDGDITDDVTVEVIGGVGPYIVNIEPFSLTTIVPGGPWPSAVPWTFLVDPTNVITNTVVTFKVTDGIGTTASANLVVYTENTGLVANTSKENVIGLANPDSDTADDVTITVAGANNPFIVSWVCSSIAATPASPVVVAGTSGTVIFDPDANTTSTPRACTVNVTDNLGSAATLNVTVWP